MQNKVNGLLMQNKVNGLLSIIGRSCRKYHFCHDKRPVLSRQTHVSLSQQIFVTTKVLTAVAYILLSGQKTRFVAANM